MGSVNVTSRLENSLAVSWEIAVVGIPLLLFCRCYGYQGEKSREKARRLFRIFWKSGAVALLVGVHYASLSLE